MGKQGCNMTSVLFLFFFVFFCFFFVFFGWEGYNIFILKTVLTLACKYATQSKYISTKRNQKLMFRRTMLTKQNEVWQVS